jgi:Domain of unknown function (DUF6457)
VDAVTWTSKFAAALGTDAPSESEVGALLSLAAVAANASERVAAPVACWLAAKAGRSPDEALALARAMSSAAPEDLS